MYLKALSCLSAFMTLASALTTPMRARTHSPSPKHHVLHQFPNGTWVENIAQRSNDELLVTLLTVPDVYAIDPKSHAQPKLVHSFAPQAGVLGITEVQRDHFYVITTNFSAATGSTGFGQGAVYSLIFNANNTITSEQIAVFPSALLLNGMSTFSAARGLVVLSDTFAGTITILNVHTGVSSILLSGPELAPPANNPSALGINGIRVTPHASANDTATIYFANDGASTLYRVSFSISTLAQTSPIELVKSGLSVDDFALDQSRGKLYLAASIENEAVELDLRTGETTVLLGGGNSTALLGPTSAVLDKGKKGKKTVYYTTNGDSVVEGGKVVAIELD